MFAKGPDVAGQVPLAFGLLDLPDEYRVMFEIRFANEAEGLLLLALAFVGFAPRLGCDGPAPSVLVKVGV